MTSRYTLGLDYGTNSVRALLVDVRTGEEIATSVFGYPHGEAGIILSPQDPEMARQNPQDYIDGAEAAIRGVLQQAASRPGFAPDQVIAIGVDTTGSTPMPVDARNRPLALDPRFTANPASMAWLWKDHTSHAEAAEITALAETMRPHYLAKCGGRYSSEWFWAKMLHCARTAPEVFEAAHTWMECADWVPAMLCGITDPAAVKRGICAAGHKGLANPAWGGYPDAEFLGALDERLAVVRATLPDTLYNISDAAGALCPEWAERTGLPAGIPVAVGALDAHLGAVGSGVSSDALVQIIGTSSCDIMVAPLEKGLPDIPGMCGIVPESVLPGHYGLEAGQSAVGDIYNWFVNVMQPGGEEAGSHEALTAGAACLRPGESGLLALDWHNGNRTVLVDQRLTGLILGLTLHTTPAEVYRALIEATAFGTRAILERMEEYGVHAARVVNCGGIAVKNPTVMQIYADVLNRPMLVGRSDQACALGSAIAAAAVAGAERGGHASFGEAVDAMAGVRDVRYEPSPADAAVYDRLYALYRQLHDAFGVAGHTADLSNVMKDLLAIRDAAREDRS